MYQVTFEAHMMNNTQGETFGHVEGNIIVQVSGMVRFSEPPYYREYTLAEAVQAALKLVGGMALSCRQVVKLNETEEHYEATRSAKLILSPQN